MSGNLTVYGIILSQPLRSVETFAKLSGIEFTHQDISLRAGENLGEDYTKINPFQSVPAIVHNGFNVWESAAIVVYLADAYNVDNQWYPKDIQIRARINSYLHWHHQNVREPVSGYLFAKVVGPKLRGLPALTEEKEAPLLEKLNNFYETLTWQLTATGYVGRTAGPTIADIFCYNELLSFSMMLGLNLDAHPVLKKWFDEIAAIPVVHEIDLLAQQALEPLLPMLRS